MANQSAAVVGIVMGSASDVEIMTHSKLTLEELGISCEVQILSAHRTPEETSVWAKGAEESGLQIIIAAAGMAAHLAGVVAAQTALPVLGVPLPGGAVDGLDSLLSTVQMPKGTPVATFSIGKAGAINAAIFAAKILSLSDPALKEKLAERKRAQAEEVAAANRNLK